MSSREANIEKLNYAIVTLNEDADDMHCLIERSTSELASATEAGNKATENAKRVIEALEPLTDLLNRQHGDSAAMLEEAKKAAEDQRSTTSEHIERLEATVADAMEKMRAQSEANGSELRETIDESLDGLRKAQAEGFEAMQTKTLKEHERTRDELQTDMLGFKNSTSARLDALEAGLAKADGSVKELDGKVTETGDAIAKKIMVPVYAAIALGGANLICLVMLLMR